MVLFLLVQFNNCFLLPLANPTLYFLSLVVGVYFICWVQVISPQVKIMHGYFYVIRSIIDIIRLVDISKFIFDIFVFGCVYFPCGEIATLNIYYRRYIKNDTLIYLYLVVYFRDCDIVYILSSIYQK
jgi:hypothetical protein